MIGPRLSEQVEYLFNYAPSEFGFWARRKFVGTPARALGSFYGLVAVGVVVALIVKARRDE